MPSNRLRICRNITIKEIPWSRIAEITSRLFNQDQRISRKQTEKFRKELLKPLSSKWLTSKKIDKVNNRIVTAICEYFSVDQIKIININSFKIGALSFEYEQEHYFTPNLRRDEKFDCNGECTVSYSIHYLGRTLHINNLNKLLFIHILLMLTLLVLYVAIGALLLYVSSVFLLFIYNPYSSTVAATCNASFGIALLSFLVLIAATSGRAIRNLISLVTRKGFKKEVNRYDNKAKAQAIGF